MPRTRAVPLLLVATLTWSGATAVASAGTVEVSTSIQAAIDDPGTQAGDTIHVPAGTYVEHVTIDKDVTLRGDGAGTIVRPVTVAAPVITVATGVDAAIETLAITGDPLQPGDVGIRAADIVGLVVTGATITSTSIGVQVTDAGGPAPSVRLRDSRVAGNETGVASLVPVDATRTWRGCIGGPGTAGCDSVSGAVTTAPNLVLRLRSAFSRIATGGAATELVGDVTRDSSGGLAGTAFPDGTPLTFSTALGTLAQATAGTSSGAAATTLTSGDTPGDSAPTVTLDQQTVGAQVAFVAPAPTVTQTVTAPTTTTTPTTTPPPTTVPDGAALLAAARKAIGSKVVRLDKDLTPGIAYVARSVRTGRGTLTIPDRDVVSLLVLVCPVKACDAGVSARVKRTTKTGAAAKPFDLRRATFALAAGRQRVVAVRLTGSRRQAIKAAKSATMTVTIAVSDPAGNRNKTTMRVSLKIAR
jgi:hypothetical protein